MNTAMGRSHAWVKRGAEFVDRVPMNWGKNLTLYERFVDLAGSS